MTAELRCPTCGAMTEGFDNVVPFTGARAAEPPQVDAVDVGGGYVRLNVHLVVTRETAIKVMAVLQETE